MKKADVIRPVFDPLVTEHPLVTLKASVSHGTVTKEYDLPLRVKMQGVTDSQAIVLDLNAIILPTETKTDLTLPTIGANGSAITWVSSDSEISNTGVVQRPDTTATDTVITLTATAAKGSETQDKTFSVKVFAWTTVEELDAAEASVGWDLIKGVNINSQAITENLVLPATVGRGVIATWASASTNLDAKTGVITRPSYTTGSVTLRLSCTLVHGGITRIVTTDTFLIANLPMTDTEAIAAATASLTMASLLAANDSSTKIISDMSLPFKVSNVDASKAVISWGLATSPGHVVLPTSPYISLTNNADYVLAHITRPNSTAGNQSVALAATITAGLAVSTVYFDITILVDPTII